LTEKALALKVVIQCAGSKHERGYFRADDGTRIEFVAHPDKAPRSQGIRFAHPDQPSDNGLTWRQRVADYNADRGRNPSSLEPAFRLYRARQYEQLVGEFGPGQVFVLSAGWGLIRSDYLIPHYNITFQRPNNPAESYIWRRPHDRFQDFNQLTITSDDHIIFLGGKNYRDYFEAFTADAIATKTIYYNSDYIFPRRGFDYKLFETARKTNWHYSCADELVELHRQQML
jgi:hypothetical protein